MSEFEVAPDYVRPGERVLWSARPTLRALASMALRLFVSFVFLLIVLAGFFLESARYLLPYLPAIVVLLYAFLLFLAALRLRRTEYSVTDQSLYVRSGIVGRTVVQTTYDKITDISLRQDVWGRLLGYSALHINTAGSNLPPLRMEGLRDALPAKSLIESTRESVLRRGGAGLAAPAPAPRLPVFVADRDLMSLVCPTTKKRFRRRRSEAGRSVPCPHCAKNHRAPEVKKDGVPRPS